MVTPGHETSAYRKPFDAFLSSLRDPDVGAGVLSPKRFSEALSVDLQTLAAQAHVHRNTVTRAPTSPNLQNFLREAVRVIRAATDLCGDVDQAIFWYRNEPLQAFAYKTAEQLVSEGRADDLIGHVMSLEAGPAG